MDQQLICQLNLAPIAQADDSALGARGKAARRACSDDDRTGGHLREVLTGSPSAQYELQAATAALMPMLDDRVPWVYRVWVAVAFLLGAISRDAPGLPDRRARQPDAPAAWISEIVDLLAQARGRAAMPAKPALSCEALTRGETRVLRYLPTNLSGREIAGKLYLSANTVKTHQRHLYQKLGARNRMEAVEQARALGLLAPSSGLP